MRTRVRLRAEAESEIEAAATWYGERSDDVAARFLTAIQESFDFLERFPNTGGRIEGVRVQSRARQVPVRTFPYQIIFMKLDDVIEVIAIAHKRQRPGYWLSRTTSTR
jgi:toxin ParE1/3/4